MSRIVLLRRAIQASLNLGARKKIGAIVFERALINPLPAAGGQPGVVPCGIVTIFGSNIAPNVQGSLNSSFLEIGLPYAFSGVTVSFNNTPAPIFGVANQNGQQQVTVQAPCELAGQATTSVTIVAGGSTTVNGVQVLPVQPGIFEADLGTGRKVAILLRPDGSLVTATNPARRNALAHRSDGAAGGAVRGITGRRQSLHGAERAQT